MTYDAAGRLTQLSYKTSANAIIEQLNYTYDARGQRISSSSLNAYPIARDTPITAIYNQANRITSLTLKGAGAPATAGGPATDETYAFSYDQNGNLTQKAGQGPIAANTTTYTWDKQNQLTGITQTAANAQTGITVSNGCKLTQAND